MNMPTLEQTAMEHDDWENRMEAVEDDVRDLKGAILGTLEGRIGIQAQLDALMHLIRKNSDISARNSDQLEALRLDKSKVMGIIVATGIIVGFGLKLLHL